MIESKVLNNKGEVINTTYSVIEWSLAMAVYYYKNESLEALVEMDPSLASVLEGPTRAYIQQFVTKVNGYSAEEHFAACLAAFTKTINDGYETMNNQLAAAKNILNSLSSADNSTATPSNLTMEYIQRQALSSFVLMLAISPHCKSGNENYIVWQELESIVNDKLSSQLTPAAQRSPQNINTKTAQRA